MVTLWRTLFLFIVWVPGELSYFGFTVSTEKLDHYKSVFVHAN